MIPPKTDADDRFSSQRSVNSHRLGLLPIATRSRRPGRGSDVRASRHQGTPPLGHSVWTLACISDVDSKVAGPPASCVRDHIDRRTVGHDPTVPEQEDTVCMRQCKVDVVGHEVEAAQPGDGHHGAHERRRRLVILAGRRLVEDEGRRAERERDRRARAASAGRTRAPGAVGTRMSSSVSSDVRWQAVGQQVIEGRSGRRSRFRGPNRISSSTVREKSIWLGLWKTYPNSVASWAVLRSPSGAPSMRIVPAVIVEQAHRRPEQRRLAGAVRTEDRDDLVGAQAARRPRGGSRGRRSRRGRPGTRADRSAASAAGSVGAAGSGAAAAVAVAAGRRSAMASRRGPARG